MANRITYTQEQKDAIVADALECISNGYSLLGYCNEKGYVYSTVNAWLSSCEDYARAREVRAEKIFDEMLAIADTEVETTKTIINDDSISIVKEDHIQHRKLQIDTRKWILGRMAPKKYGDKLDLTTDGEKITQPTIVVNSPESGKIITDLINGE
jgi:hypothetical protein